MARNKQSIVPRWHQGTPGAKYDPAWIAAELRGLNRVLSQWGDMFDDGSIPGTTISYSWGPISIDNGGGGAPVTKNYRHVLESSCEPRFWAGVAGTVTGSAVTCDLFSGTSVLTSPPTCAVGTATVFKQYASSAFSQPELSRQGAINAVITVPAGATVTDLMCRFVAYRAGRILDTGVTGSLGR